MFLSKLKTVLRSTGVKEADVKCSDSFADSLALDLKRCSIEAILATLSKLEGKYLSTILQSSYFPVESIVFAPLDNETSVEIDNFFKIHSAIDPSFEQSFYRTILLKEYRTEHGGVAMPSEQIVVTVQPTESSADTLTEEEAYQITMRGSKKRFNAQVVLGSPKRIPGGKSFQSVSSTGKEREEPTLDRASERFFEKASLNTRIEVTINDANGFVKKVIPLPTILGREGDSGFQGIENKQLINSKFVSRNQIVVFGVGEKTFFYIPESSKLLAVMDGKKILNKMSLVEISNQPISVTFGQPENAPGILVQANEPALYPSITLKMVPASVVLNATPIPHVS